MAINVDQFVVFSGSNVSSPLVFEGGILKLVNAKIVQAQIENLLVEPAIFSRGGHQCRDRVQRPGCLRQQPWLVDLVYENDRSRRGVAKDLD